MVMKRAKKMRRIPKSFVFDEDVVEMLRELKESLNSKSEAYAAQEAIREAWKARFPEKKRRTEP
jgi:hypothetical protein